MNYILQSHNDTPFFFSEAWQKVVSGVFPQVVFSKHVYRDLTLALSSYGEQGILRGIPFSDVGAGYVENGKHIDAQDFASFCASRFHDRPYTIDINTVYAPMIHTEKIAVSFYDYVLDLKQYSSSEAFLQERTKTFRYDIRKSQDVAVREDTERKYMNACYQVYLVSMRDKANTVFPFSLFSSLYLQTQSRVFVAVEKDVVVGFSLFLEYNVHAHYFLSSVLPRFRKKRIGYALLWTYVQQLLSQKCLVMGTARPETGLAAYKEAWGAVSYPVYRFTNQKQEDVLRTSCFRSLWRYIPLCLIEPLSRQLWKYRL